MMMQMAPVCNCCTGMTECCGKISMSMLPMGSGTDGLEAADLLAIATSSGKPFGQIDARLVDSEGRDIHWRLDSDLDPGECTTRGETVFNGYYKRDDATEATFRDGWFKTGDLALPMM